MDSVNVNTGTREWVVYGTTCTGIEDNFIVSANTKAEVLEYMEEAFGDFFHVEHIVEQIS